MLSRPVQAVKLLAEFWSCSPEDYDTQYATDAKSVRQAGDVVVQLAERLPKVRDDVWHWWWGTLWQPMVPADLARAAPTTVGIRGAL
jgi:hypothetical protein